MLGDHPFLERLAVERLGLTAGIAPALSECRTWTTLDHL